ncbi:HIT domain-containing protein [Metallumcola ferriviriculae]|uniref:HIT domain-containing protein n=1 Tax=Metallumcola ferriviriculae TaxID=3039180 RepID=A0AAU0UK21_9FIRM|nr:HIT domain-containing protein [Desulfitibacteraceae bacterium MK1]
MVVGNCIFCEIRSDQKLFENDYAFAIADKYPITRGHTLVIPKRHFVDFFEIRKEERDAIMDLLIQRKKQLLEGDSYIEGFNVGVNIGKAAAQAVFHCHIHLIPRRIEETPNWNGRS